MCMRPLVHNIEISVFEKDSSNLNSIYDLFNDLLSIDFEKEKIVVHHKKTEGFEQDVIHILSLKTHNHRHSWSLLRNIFQNLNREDVEKIYEQRDSRLDDHGFFFIRLDKRSLLNGVYKLTELGDCFHFKIKIAAFPSKRKNTMKSLEELLDKMRCCTVE